ncbi:MAG: cation transporter [Actinomycetes bacterium]
MTARFGDTELDAERQRALRSAVRLQVGALVYLVSVVALMTAVMGNSQAMKAALAEDVLALLPPIAFLLAVRRVRRRTSEEYPYGHHRAVSTGHLAASVALLAMGLFVMGDSALTLITQEHPTLGTFHLFGTTIWQGWVMIPVLVYTGLPNIVLGRIKLRLSDTLHDKVLFADAEMNKGDWLTAGGAILGIIGIGIGWWWADSAVAIAIAATIVKDGVSNLRGAVADLADRRARTYDDSEIHPCVDQVKRFFEQLPWVGEVSVRMRDMGHVFHTEVFVVPASGEAPLAELERARSEASGMDWRLDDLVVVPVRTLP